MTLLVEDGSNVAGANTYVDLAGVRAYALTRGVTLDPNDAILEPLVHKAMDLLEGFRSRYQGTKTTATQPLQFPRTGLQIDCVDFDANSIPIELINAENQIIMEQHAGIDLSPTKSGAFIIEDTVGPITTKYSDVEGPGVGKAPIMPVVEDLLAPLFVACGQGLLLKTIKV